MSLSQIEPHALRVGPRNPASAKFPATDSDNSYTSEFPSDLLRLSRL